jgi:hypothetical protein
VLRVIGRHSAAAMLPADAAHPHTLTPKDREWSHTTHGAYACKYCADVSEESREIRDKIDDELHRIFYAEAPPHKYQVCCHEYVIHRVFDDGRVGVSRHRGLRAVAENMYTFNASPTHTAQWLCNQAERYVLMRHYDDAIESLTARVATLEARLAALDSDVSFLKEVDHVRHIDVLHASKKRMYEAADKKI